MVSNWDGAAYDNWLYSQADEYYSECTPKVVKVEKEYEGPGEYSDNPIYNCDGCVNTDCEHYYDYHPDYRLQTAYEEEEVNNGYDKFPARNEPLGRLLLVPDTESNKLTFALVLDKYSIDYDFDKSLEENIKACYKNFIQIKNEEFAKRKGGKDATH